MAPRPRPKPSQSSGQPDRTALLQAYQDVIRSANTKPPVLPPEPGSRAPFWVTMGTLIAVLTTISLWQPPWLFTPPPRESPALVEASLRVRLFTEIERIERYQAAQGRLPTTLEAAGGNGTGLEYKPLNSKYTLTGNTGDIKVTYTSGTPARRFLGNSYVLIRARQRPGS